MYQRILSRIGSILLAVIVILFTASVGSAQEKAAMPTSGKPTIVLVHGAFADASGWSHVIPALEKAGYQVTAVQNPLTSVDADVETTRRVIDAQPGPVVLVGHSYGGAVITAASAGAKNVKALVYVSAMAPDSGEVVGALFQKYPPPMGDALRPDAAGFLYIDRARFKSVFAPDVPEPEASVMEATQKPVHGAAFGHVFGAPGWKTIPSWFIVAKNDQVIHPDLERLFAARMKAKTTELASSHVPFISQPAEVIRVIEEAAASVK